MTMSMTLQQQLLKHIDVKEIEEGKQENNDRPRRRRLDLIRVRTLPPTGDDSYEDDYDVQEQEQLVQQQQQQQQQLQQKYVWLNEEEESEVEQYTVFENSQPEQEAHVVYRLVNEGGGGGYPSDLNRIEGEKMMMMFTGRTKGSSGSSSSSGGKGSGYIRGYSDHVRNNGAIFVVGNENHHRDGHDPDHYILQTPQQQQAQPQGSPHFGSWWFGNNDNNNNDDLTSSGTVSPSSSSSSSSSSSWTSTTVDASSSSLLSSSSSIIVWNYLFYISLALCCWVIYLILPKGFRKQFCRANRRQYKRTPSQYHHLSVSGGGGGADTATMGGSSVQTLTEVFLKEIEKRRREASARDTNTTTTTTTNNNINQSNNNSSSNNNNNISSIGFHREEESEFTPLQTQDDDDDDDKQQEWRDKYDQLDDADSGYPKYKTVGNVMVRRSSSPAMAAVGNADGKAANHAIPDLTSYLMHGNNNTTDTPRTPTRPSKTTTEDEDDNFTKVVPSPEHPAISKLPQQNVITETMRRLKGRGIRLLAHGVASDCKRVWIRIEDDNSFNNMPPYNNNNTNHIQNNPMSYYSVTWQTEFPRKVPNQSGEISIVLMRGALHRIALPNVLFIDVGKKTNAFKKQDNADVPDSVCLSLLTQNGSLDLQANSRLERDALVACFSLVLDEVHTTRDWRSLYATSPESSSIVSAPNTNVNNTNTNIQQQQQQQSSQSQQLNSSTDTQTAAPSSMTGCDSISEFLFDSDMVEV